jgi:hypothetical protein
MKTVRAIQAGGPRRFCGAAVAAEIVLAVGCHASGITCASVGGVLPIITVTDARTGAAICDATVVVVLPPDASTQGIPPDSSYWQLNAVMTLPDGETVLVDGSSTACTYTGASLTGAGAFTDLLDTPITLVVSTPGYRTTTATAVTKGYGCSAPPPPDRVNVLLEPQ